MKEALKRKWVQGLGCVVSYKWQWVWKCHCLILIITEMPLDFNKTVLLLVIQECQGVYANPLIKILTTFRMFTKRVPCSRTKIMGMMILFKELGHFREQPMWHNMLQTMGIAWQSCGLNKLLMGEGVIFFFFLGLKSWDKRIITDSMVVSRCVIYMVLKSHSWGIGVLLTAFAHFVPYLELMMICTCPSEVNFLISQSYNKESTEKKNQISNRLQ